MPETASVATKPRPPCPRVSLYAELSADGKWLEPAHCLGAAESREAGAVLNYQRESATALLGDYDVARWLSSGSRPSELQAYYYRSRPPPSGLSVPFARDLVVDLGKHITPRRAMDHLRSRGHERVICLGGGELIRAMLESGYGDDLYLVVHPRIDGRRTAPTLSGLPACKFFSRSISCRLLHMEVRQGQCFLHYRIHRSRSAR